MAKADHRRSAADREKRKRSEALRAWCTKFGRGAITYLQNETGLTFAATSRIVKGTAAPRAENALAFERATRGEVKAAVLLGLEAA